MTTPPTQSEPTITDVIQRIDELDQKVENQINTFKVQLEAYEKGMRWVVNLAFGLIASATITVLLTTLFDK